MVYLHRVGPLPGERWALQHWPQWPPRPRPLQEFVDVADLAGLPVIAGTTMLVILWLVRRGIGRRAVLFLVVAAAGVVFNDLLKRTIGPTPLWAESHGGAAAGANYPSGHVVYATVVAGALAVLAWERRRVDLLLLAAVVVVGMGPMRVLQGVHLPSDAIAGYLVGGGWLVMATRLTGHGRRAERREPPGAEGPSRTRPRAT